MSNTEEVNNVAHYDGDQCMRDIEMVVWGRDFCLGNAYKYLFRLGKKDPAKISIDAQKARWYMERYHKQHPNDRLTRSEALLFRPILHSAKRETTQAAALLDRKGEMGVERYYLEEAISSLGSIASTIKEHEERPTP